MTDLRRLTLGADPQAPTSDEALNELLLKLGSGPDRALKTKRLSR